MPALRIISLVVLLLASGAAQEIYRTPPRAPAGAASGPNNGSVVTLGPGRSALHADDGPQVTFRSSSRLVLVSVIATDKSGTHVSGLARDDFQLQENGKARPLATFEEVHALSTPVRRGTVGKGEFSNATAEAAPRRVTVILLDAVNTPFLDQSYGRRQVIQYLAEKLEPGEIISLMAIDRKGVRMIHGFSSDAVSLVAAMKKVGSSLPGAVGEGADPRGLNVGTRALGEGSRPDDQRDNVASPGAAAEQTVREFIESANITYAKYSQQEAVRDTMACFLEVAHALAGIRGRKALIWITSGFPFYMDGPAAVPGGELGMLYTRTVEALSDANVSVYPVDARGLMGGMMGSDASNAMRLERGQVVPTENRAWLQFSSQQSLRDFAEMTGGRAFYSRNDLTTGFQRASYDSSHYYLLGYYLDTKDRDPGWRKLKVKVRRAGIEARHRGGFFVTQATGNPEMTRRMEVLAALQSPFDSTGLSISGRFLTATPGADGKKTVTFTLMMPGTALYVDPSQKNRLALEIVGVARTTAGAEADQFLQRVETEVPEDKVAGLQKDGMQYSNAMHLAPGQYTVRFVVRDNATGRLGSVSVPIIVR